MHGARPSKARGRSSQPFRRGFARARVGRLSRERRGPRYTEARSASKEAGLNKYICTVCDYLYDPEIGDPDNGVEPGTAFEDLPDDWVCPDCGVEKDEFELVEDNG